MAFLVLVFLLLSFGVVALPLLTPQRRWQGFEEGESEELVEEKDSALSAIRDLEFEHDIGNLSEPDFASLRDEYTDRAARVLQRLDRVPVEQPPEEPAELDEEDEAAQGEGEFDEYCTACGGPVAPEDRYCGSCGAYLIE